MANTNKDIESRLCAYIDGELNEADRAEIERHLEAHPQHRQMIRQLIEARQLLAELPRAIAPGELGDGLQSQLERSILLGEGLTWSEPRRGGRTLFLAAASVFLVIGLTIGAYVARRVRPIQVASNAPTPVVEKILPTTAPSVEAVAAKPEAAASVIPTVVKMYLLVLAPDPLIGGDEIAGCLAADGLTIEPMPTPATQPALAAADTQPSTQPAILAAYSAPATQPSSTNYLGILKNLPRQRADQLVDELFKQDAEMKCRIVDSLDNSTTQPSTQPSAQTIDLAIVVKPLPQAPTNLQPAAAVAPPSDDANDQGVSPPDDPDDQAPATDMDAPSTQPVAADGRPG